MKRRTFIKTTAAALTALAMSSFPAFAAINMETDLVIIGGGASGLAAGVQATELGADVIVLEKQAKAGGTGNYAEGLFASESSLQHKQGIIVTNEFAFQTIMDYSHWKANAPLVSAFVNKSGPTIDWLMDQGVKFKYIGPGGPGGVLTWHVIDGYSKAMMKIFVNKIEERGSKILLNTPGEELIYENGKVVGVKATNKEGEEINIRAKSVVISTGGYANNKEMMKKYSPYPDLIPIGQIGKDGDGIKMAWGVGADEEGIAVMQSYRPGLKGFHPASHLVAAAVQPYLWVNQDGYRYTDESRVILWPYAGNALEREGGTAFSIYDDNTRKKFIEEGVHLQLGNWVHAGDKLTELDKEFNKELKRGKGNVFKADTIEELAEMMGIDPKVLTETVDKNNYHASIREDEEYYKVKTYLREVKQPPFYATKMNPRFLGTLGGVKINEHTQAIAKDSNQPIPGLYVTGNDAGGMYGDSYDLLLGGGTLGFAVNSGRIAAEHAVSQMKLK